MFTRVTIGLLLFVAAKSADTSATAQQSADSLTKQGEELQQLKHESKKELREQRKEAREQRKEQEKKEAQTAATNLAATVQKDHTQIEKSMTALKNFQQTLRTSYNKTLCQAHAQRMVQEAHDSRESQRQQMRKAFTTAHDAAERKRAQLDEVAKSMANMTGATEASTDALRKQAQDTNSALAAQLELMATKIEAMRKANNEERRDVRHKLDKFQHSLRETAKTHVKAARAAVRDMERSSKKLEREQRRAGDSESTYEGTEEKNEQLWESYRDQVEDIAEDLQDSIEDIRDRMEGPLEHEMDSAHDRNEHDVAALRHQYHHTVEMASQARHSMTHASRATERMLAKTSTKQDVSLLSSEIWSNAQAPPLACIAAIFIGTAAAFVVDSFQRRRQVSTHDGFAQLI